MELLNVGKLKVAKKYESAIKIIEKVGEEYNVELNEGYVFSWGNDYAIEYTQKELLNTIKEIMTLEEYENKYGKIGKVETMEKIETKIENKIEIIPSIQFINSGNFVENESHSVDIVTSYLLGEKTLSQLVKSYGYEYTMKTLGLYNLEKINYGNFKDIKNRGTIFSCLKFYKRFDIIGLFELKFYGMKSSERIKGYGIKEGLNSSHFRMKVAK